MLGFKAMMRRVFKGRWFKPRIMTFLIGNMSNSFAAIPDAVNNGAGYRLRINRLPAGEIARLADYVPYLHAAELLKLLPDNKAASVLRRCLSIDRYR